MNAKQAFCLIMGKEKLEYFVASVIIEEKCNKHEKICDGLSKWFYVRRVTAALKALRECDVKKGYVCQHEKAGHQIDW